MTTADRITTTEAATRLGLSVARVRQLIATGRLDAIKHGRDWMLNAEEVGAYVPRPRGMPRQPDDAVSPQALYKRLLRARSKERTGGQR